jgi:hypothetical protein
MAYQLPQDAHKEDDLLDLQEKKSLKMSFIAV